MTPGRKVLLDTNAVIGLLRDKAPELRTSLAAMTLEERTTSVIVEAELLVGVAKGAEPERRRRELVLLLSGFVVQDFTRTCAEHYAEIRAHLERTGQPIGPNDLLIAATARANGATVVTRNLGEFRRVPGLLVEAW